MKNSGFFLGFFSAHFQVIVYNLFLYSAVDIFRVKNGTAVIMKFITTVSKTVHQYHLVRFKIYWFQIVLYGVRYLAISNLGYNIFNRAFIQSNFVTTLTGKVYFFIILTMRVQRSIVV